MVSLSYLSLAIYERHTSVSDCAILKWSPLPDAMEPLYRKWLSNTVYGTHHNHGQSISNEVHLQLFKQVPILVCRNQHLGALLTPGNIIYLARFIYTYVVGVTKMGNIVPRVGIEPTSLAFRVSVLPLHDIGSLMSPLCPRQPVYAAACLRSQCRLLYLFTNL